MTSVLVLVLVWRVSSSRAFATWIESLGLYTCFTRLWIAYEFHGRNETSFFQFFLHLVSFLLTTGHYLLIKVAMQVGNFLLVEFIGALQIPETSSDVTHASSDCSEIKLGINYRLTRCFRHICISTLRAGFSFSLPAFFLDHKFSKFYNLN